MLRLGVFHFDSREARGYARGMRTRHLLLSLSLVTALMANTALATTLYKWIDATGVTHYSDQPMPGAQKMDVASAQTYKALGTAPTRPQKSTQAPVAAYSRLAITQPVPEQTFQVGRIDISAVLDPGLRPGDALWFLIDGARDAEPAQGLSTSIELSRGSHTASVLVADATGTVIIASEAVTFYVHGASILQPPKGPLLMKK